MTGKKYMVDATWSCNLNLSFPPPSFPPLSFSLPLSLHAYIFRENMYCIQSEPPECVKTNARYATRNAVRCDVSHAPRRLIRQTGNWLASSRYRKLILFRDKAKNIISRSAVNNVQCMSPIMFLNYYGTCYLLLHFVHKLFNQNLVCNSVYK